ncbi:DUF2515 domain-containing protein [Salipaludibacillus sp. LMS25]|jgi:hypothetical protein|uniref:DUF2515 family protein n=1 Tax=Salipaludibacillus sp. LMS25 TaxID=2924031 RepID=UPI0020D18040|nr:DUF2515 family protein [Salipaludibacillus sp. LMS25]UTR14673.1 DUF2515 domain-containing protein [Salipaludibacillus sp. LMS25]
MMNVNCQFSQQAIGCIQQATFKHNRDNISRTTAYANYFMAYPEIRWAYLAHMVSRNAGWSMTDLTSKAYKTLLSKEWRRCLFMTYERANWLIFSDAYPQLMVYRLSKEMARPLFHLLSAFSVSSWMIHEWEYFWYCRDINRLLLALIVNEQHVIDKPIIRSSPFKSVFHTSIFKWQETFHFNVVLFPSYSKGIYGCSVKDFTNVIERINLGKQLSWLLFQAPCKKEIYDYFKWSPYTGSRLIDIRGYLSGEKSLPLRVTFPYIRHEDIKRIDWSKDERYKPNKALHRHVKRPVQYDLTKWYAKKHEQMLMTAKLVAHVKNSIK